MSRSARDNSGPGKPVRASQATTRRTLVLDTVIDHATRLFAEKGYEATNFQDIADAVGISRPSLYHYVSSKEDLLVALVAGSKEFTEILSSLRYRTDLEPAGRLDALVRTIVKQRTESPDRFRILDRSEALLPDEVRREHHQIRRDLLADLVAIIEDGVAQGDFRPQDTRVAALAVLGMCNWVAWWFKPDRDGDGTAVVNQVAQNVAAMLANAVPSDAASPELTSFDRIRAEVDALERVFDARTTRDARSSRQTSKPPAAT